VFLCFDFLSLNYYVHFVFYFRCRCLIYPILPIVNRICTWNLSQRCCLFCYGCYGVYLLSLITKRRHDNCFFFFWEDDNCLLQWRKCHFFSRIDSNSPFINTWPPFVELILPIIRTLFNLISQKGCSFFLHHLYHMWLGCSDIMVLFHC